MNKCFIMLGGNALNRGVLDKFSSKGYYTIIVDWNKKIALESQEHWPLDVKYPQEVLAKMSFVKDNFSEAMAFTSVDLATVTMSKLLDFLGKSCCNAEALEAILSKFSQCKSWNKAGLLRRKFLQKLTIPSTEEMIDFVGKKIIVKPDSGSSSNGITIFESFEYNNNFLLSFEKAMERSWNNKVIIEEFVVGREFTVEMLGDKFGNVQVYGISAKTHTVNVEDNKIAVKLHYNSDEYGSDLYQKISEFGIACYKSLGLKSSFGHLEMLIDKFGNFHPVEIGARSSGYIASHLVDWVSGRDYLADLEFVFSGGKIGNGFLCDKKSAVYFFYDFPNNSKIVKEGNIVDFLGDGVISCAFDRACIKVGNAFSRINSDNERVGFEVLLGDQKTLSSEILRKAEEKFLNYVLADL